MHCAPEANCNWQTPVSKCPLPVWAAASRLPVKIEPTSHPQGSLVLPAQQGRPRTSKCRAESPTCVHESQLGIIQVDPLLANHEGHLLYRWERFQGTLRNICENAGSLVDFAKGYQKFGFNRSQGCTTYREWAPGASSAQLIGDFNNWNGTWMERDEYGIWSCTIPDNMDGTPGILHKSKVKIRLKHTDGWSVDVLPAWTSFAVANTSKKGVRYDALYWDPPRQEKYKMLYPRPPSPSSLRIYEVHVGIGSQEKRVASFDEFTDQVMPRIVKQGYNAIQLMAIQEHAYYGSFGYHVTNPFAVSSRFGTPEDLKKLIDTAHSKGLVVILDVVHSHLSKNAVDGLPGFDMGQREELNYFYSGDRGTHKVWDSRLLNYGNWEVLRYLLSNLAWWIEEYKFDGFRFDGVTSMMYHHHGINFNFTGSYGEYFTTATNVDAVVYLMLANMLVHELLPEAITICEDVSGMPSLCRPVVEGGVGFDFRLSMGIPDRWFTLVGSDKDETWKMGEIAAFLVNRRESEKYISYVESHDQCLVGGQTLAFKLMGVEMWTGMSCLSAASPAVSRGMALHKLIRLITIALGGDAWLNFIGNEFGHPDWLDFPRDGNDWSYEKCCRQWNLVDDLSLRYQYLNAWDAAMMRLEVTCGFLQHRECNITRISEEAQIIVAERGPLVFAFNFSSTSNVKDMEVGVSQPGRYSLILDSDAVEFGGEGQLGAGLDNIPSRPTSMMMGNCRHALRICSPCRTATVYKLV